MINCSKCDKEMSTSDDTFTVISARISLVYSDSIPQNHKELIERQSGKYVKKGKLNFCYECCIDALIGEGPIK